jgi:hypothetical protein
VNVSFIEIYNEIFFNLEKDQLGSNLTESILIKLNYLIYFSIGVISFNHRILYEKQFINKIFEGEDSLTFDFCKIREETTGLSMMNDSINGGASNYINSGINPAADADTEIQLISQVFSKIFQILNYSLSLIKLNQNRKIIEILEPGIFYFLKNFCKHFLSKTFSNKLLNTFHMLSDILKLSDNSMILSFIINFLIEVSKNIQKFKTLQNVIKIFQIIESNSHIQIDTVTDEKIIYIGKLSLHQDFLNSILELHNLLITLNPEELGKYRTIFYRSILKIILLKSSENNEIFNSLINFYVENIQSRREVIRDESNMITVLGYMKDLLGVCSAISLKEDYKNFVFKISNSLENMKYIHSNCLHSSEFTLSFLNFLENLTRNQFDRVHFPMNCKLYFYLIYFSFS